jgi:hypothetical protein
VSYATNFGWMLKMANRIRLAAGTLFLAMATLVPDKIAPACAIIVVGIVIEAIFSDFD